MLTIRQATEHDAGNLAQIQQAAFMPLYERYHDEDNPALRGIEDILRRLHTNVHRYWCILYNDLLIGGIFYRKISEEEYYLQRIYIKPEFQGKGFAVSAIQLCEKELGKVKRYTLDFPVDCTINRKCYEKAGFSDTGERMRVNELLMVALYEKIIKV